MRLSFALAFFAASLAACRSGSLALTASPPPPSVCPIEGCADQTLASRTRSVAPACDGFGESACEGSAPADCGQRALAAWSEAQDDRAVACVARLFDEACALGDARSCAFGGRMLLDGRGVERDVNKGFDMVVRACDGGVDLACVVGLHWLGEPTHARDISDASDWSARLEAQHGCLTGEPQACFQLGLLFYFARHGCSRDLTRAVAAYRRGCDLGAPLACNNLGDALEYGDGVERDATRSAAMFEKACRLGEAMGCANWGHLFEVGQGLGRNFGRARELYREACVGGDVYGCLHADMVAAQYEGGVPRDARGALAYWRKACDRGRGEADAQACAFIGVIYEDGQDGQPRDADKSQLAMRRGCDLGSERACQWMKGHAGD